MPEIVYNILTDAEKDLLNKALAAYFDALSHDDCDIEQTQYDELSNTCDLIERKLGLIR